MTDVNKKEDDLEDFDPETNEEDAEETEGVTEGAPAFSGVHISGFRDFMLRPELNRAIQDAGFEHPSEVQHQCIPQAMLGQDVLCQAKSGMGKTAVFVMSVLQQLEEPSEDATKAVQCLVLCHARELAYQIKNEFERFAKYLPWANCGVFYGGTPVPKDVARLQPKSDAFPNIVVGTPGRIADLTQRGALKLSKLKFFILDECDQLLKETDMRRDVQTAYLATPKTKQVMMYSATMPSDIRTIAKKFMNDPVEIFVDSEAKLTLHGLLQYYDRVPEAGKNKKLGELLDMLEFNQVVIFVKSVQRAKALAQVLKSCSFPSVCMHSGMKQDERISTYQEFKEFKSRIMVSTDLFGRGIDIERVNIVINYDMPENADQYLHRVGRAGRFGTKGLAITFLSCEEDTELMNEVQKRFAVEVGAVPESIEASQYMQS